jgi:hypothetical protein
MEPRPALRAPACGSARGVPCSPSGSGSA